MYQLAFFPDGYFQSKFSFLFLNNGLSLMFLSTFVASSHCLSNINNNLNNINIDFNSSSNNNNNYDKILNNNYNINHNLNNNFNKNSKNFNNLNRNFNNSSTNYNNSNKTLTTTTATLMWKKRSRWFDQSCNIPVVNFPLTIDILLSRPSV